jgi:hypothetical protein
MREAAMTIVAVTLLSMMILLCLLTWGLIRAVSKSRGTLIIESKAVAILIRFFFHVEYRPSDQAGPAPGITQKSLPVELPAGSPDETSVSGADLRNGGDGDVI